MPHYSLHALANIVFLSNDVQLIVIQSPKTAKMAIGKEKGRWRGLKVPLSKLTLPTDRKPMDPPPVVQLKIPSDRTQDFMYSKPIVASFCGGHANDIQVLTIS